jgi:hypothetical protein
VRREEIMAKNSTDHNHTGILGIIEAGMQDVIRTVVLEMVEKGELDGGGGGLVTRANAAKFLDVNPTEIDRLRENGEIKVHQKPGGDRKYPVASLRNYIRRHLQE